MQAGLMLGTQDDVDDDEEETLLEGSPFISEDEEEEPLELVNRVARLTAGGIDQLALGSRRDEAGRSGGSRYVVDDSIIFEEDETEEVEDTSTPLYLCAIAIDRYIPDQTAVRLLQGDDAGTPATLAYTDLFDVTLTDGTLKRKCLLHPSLNAHVYAGRLTAGQVVRVRLTFSHGSSLLCRIHTVLFDKVERWHYWFDETVIGGEGVIIITDIICTFDRVEIDQTAIAYQDGASAQERNGCPLIGMRGFYIHVSNDTFIYGSNWGKLEDEEMSKANGEGNASKRWQGRISISDEELEQLVGLSMEEFLSGHWLRENDENGDGSDSREQLPRGNLYTISDIMEEHESISGRQRAGAGPFIARVVQKSKVIHYAKTSDSNIKYPVRAELVVRDRTEAVTIVLWTNMCAYYYPHIDVGDLLLIGKYRIKPQYPNPHGPPWELALNAGTAYLFKLTDSQVPRNIPRISFDICASSQLQTIANGQSFDYMGRIVFKGRQERVRKTAEWNGNITAEGVYSSQIGGFRHYRWLLLQDLESINVSANGHFHQTPEENMRTRGLLVKLFTNSQDFESRFGELQEGHIILLTDLKLVVLEDDADFHRSTQTITLSRSTNFTQVYIFGGPEPSNRDIQDVISSYPLSNWHRFMKEEVANTLQWNAIAHKFYSRLAEASRVINKQFSLLPLTSVFLRPFPLHFYQATHPHVGVRTMREVASIAASLHHMERASLLVQGLIYRIYSHYPRKQAMESDEAAPISRKRKTQGDSTLLVDMTRTGRVHVATEARWLDQPGKQLDHRNSSISGFPSFPAPSLLTYFDGLLPIVSLAIDIESLNKNARCEKLILMVPMDVKIATRIAGRRSQHETLNRDDRVKRQRLDETTVLEEDEEEFDSSNRQMDDSTASREEVDSYSQIEATKSIRTTPWQDREKEEIALLSLARYLSLQYCLTAEEEEELNRFLAPYELEAESDSEKQADSNYLYTQPASESRRAWPTMAEVRRWTAKVISERRLVFLIELYARPGPQRTVERVVTALFPPERTSDVTREKRSELAQE